MEQSIFTKNDYRLNKNIDINVFRYSIETKIQLIEFINYVNTTLRPKQVPGFGEVPYHTALLVIPFHVLSTVYLEREKDWRYAETKCMWNIWLTFEDNNIPLGSIAILRKIEYISMNTEIPVSSSSVFKAFSQIQKLIPTLRIFQNEDFEEGNIVILNQHKNNSCTFLLNDNYYQRRFQMLISVENKFHFTSLRIFKQSHYKHPFFAIGNLYGTVYLTLREVRLSNLSKILCTLARGNRIDLEVKYTDCPLELYCFSVFMKQWDSLFLKYRFRSTDDALFRMLLAVNYRKMIEELAKSIRRRVHAQLATSLLFYYHVRRSPFISFLLSYVT